MIAIAILLAAVFSFLYRKIYTKRVPVFGPGAEKVIDPFSGKEITRVPIPGKNVITGNETTPEQAQEGWEILRTVDKSGFPEVASWANFSGEAPESLTYLTKYAVGQVRYTSAVFEDGSTGYTAGFTVKMNLIPAWQSFINATKNWTLIRSLKVVHAALHTTENQDYKFRIELTRVNEDTTSVLILAVKK